ncbi:hypothetical protein ACQR1I_19605 [Bradyrhizobium sp. HKCCYLS2038]|uniref:hypothetical protein n=1 Tax=Bradyrhizobium sp. HKCCYLS2038 TaxID=3420764 RepID=UPI003EB7FFD0
MAVRPDLSARTAPAEVPVASTTICDLGAAGSDRIVITGSNAITSFGTAANRRIRLRWAGSVTVTANPASLVLSGGADITTSPGDIWNVESDAAGNWRMIGCELAALAPGGADGGTF